MERRRENEQFSKKDLQILRGLRSGKDLDKMLDRADLEGYEYRFVDLNRLRELTSELGFDDVADLIPPSNFQTRNNILKHLHDARQRYDGQRLYRRMGVERINCWMMKTH